MLTNKWYSNVYLERTSDIPTGAQTQHLYTDKRAMHGGMHIFYGTDIQAICGMGWWVIGVQRQKFYCKLMPHLFLFALYVKIERQTDRQSKK